MNKYLESLVTGLAIGTSLGIFVVLAVFMRERMDDRSPDDETEFIDRSSAVFVQERVLTDNEYVTVTGFITNESDKTIHSAWVTANLYDSIGIIGSCDDRVKGLVSKESRPVAIKCYAFKSANVPSDLEARSFVSMVEAIK